MVFKAKRRLPHLNIKLILNTFISKKISRRVAKPQRIAEVDLSIQITRNKFVAHNPLHSPRFGLHPRNYMEYYYPQIDAE